MNSQSSILAEHLRRKGRGQRVAEDALTIEASKLRIR